MEQTVTAMININPVDEEENYSKMGGDTGTQNNKSRENSLKNRFKIFSSFNIRKKSAGLVGTPRGGRISAEMEEWRNGASRNQLYFPNMNSSTAK